MGEHGNCLGELGWLGSEGALLQRHSFGEFHPCQRSLLSTHKPISLGGSTEPSSHGDSSDLMSCDRYRPHLGASSNWQGRTCVRFLLNYIAVQ